MSCLWVQRVKYILHSPGKVGGIFLRHLKPWTLSLGKYSQTNCIPVRVGGRQVVSAMQRKMLLEQGGLMLQHLWIPAAPKVPGKTLDPGPLQ